MQELTLFDTSTYADSHTGLRESAIDTEGHDPSWDEPTPPVKSDAGDIDKSEGNGGESAIAPDFDLDEKILYALDSSNKSKSDIALAMALGETVFKIQPVLSRLVSQGRLAREGNRYRRLSTEKTEAANFPAATFASIIEEVTGDESGGDDANPFAPKPEPKSEPDGEPSEPAAVEKIKPPSRAELKPGMRVRVIHGKITGQRGTVEDVCRAWVSVALDNGDCVVLFPNEVLPEVERSYGKTDRAQHGWVERHDKKVKGKVYRYHYYRYEIWEGGKLIKTPSISIKKGMEGWLDGKIRFANFSVDEILECREQWAKHRR